MAESIAWINVLGTEYEIKKLAFNEDELFSSKNIDGYCDTSACKIIVMDKKTDPDYETKDVDRIEAHMIRHEIVHAFMYESGLDASAHKSKDDGWAVDEEVIDWIAIQSPKMFQIFNKLDLMK